MGSIVFSHLSGRATSTANWLAPVQAVFAFFAPPQCGAHAVPNQRPEDSDEPSRDCQTNRAVAHESTNHVCQLGPTLAPLVKPNRGKSKACAISSLKVLREFEPGESRSSTGRLVISGRIADVCEALDRMATQSAVTH